MSNFADTVHRAVVESGRPALSTFIGELPVAIRTAIESPSSAWSDLIHELRQTLRDELAAAESAERDARTALLASAPDQCEALRTAWLAARSRTGDLRQELAALDDEARFAEPLPALRSLCEDWLAANAAPLAAAVDARAAELAERATSQVSTRARSSIIADCRRQAEQELGVGRGEIWLQVRAVRTLRDAIDHRQRLTAGEFATFGNC